MEWAKRLVAALKEAEKAAADGGAYGLAQRLAKMAEPFVGVIADEDHASMLADAAGIERKPGDVCIVNVPSHWIDLLRIKAAEISNGAPTAESPQEQPT